MDRQYIEDQQLVERYVQGRLVGDELADFEIFMLEHPDVVDDVEYEKVLQGVLERAANDLRPASSRRRNAPAPSGFLFGRRYGMAATMLLVVSLVYGGYAYLAITNLEKQVSDLQSPALVTTEFWFEPVRGGDRRVIDRPPGSGLLLRVDTGTRQSIGTYSVEIIGEDNGVFWSRANVDADAEQSISISASSLPAGNYVLRILADGDPSAIPIDYPFTLRLPGG